MKYFIIMKYNEVKSSYVKPILTKKCYYIQYNPDNTSPIYNFLEIVKELYVDT